MEPDRPRGTCGISGGCLARFPDRLFWELLRMLELLDHQVRVLEGCVTQSEAKLESWSDIFLVGRISNGRRT